MNHFSSLNPATTTILQCYTIRRTIYQHVRETVSYRGLFTAGWFGVREKHYSQLEIYDRLRANEQIVCLHIIFWTDVNLS